MRPHLWITFGQISMGAEKTVKIAGVDQRRPPVVSRRFYFFFSYVFQTIFGINLQFFPLKMLSP